MALCPHESVKEVLDLPLCDENMNYIGRFDAQMCEDCGAILAQEATAVPAPVLTEGRDIIPPTE